MHPQVTLTPGSGFGSFEGSSVLSSLDVKISPRTSIQLVCMTDLDKFQPLLNNILGVIGALFMSKVGVEWLSFGSGFFRAFWFSLAILASCC